MPFPYTFPFLFDDYDQHGSVALGLTEVGTRAIDSHRAGIGLLGTLATGVRALPDSLRTGLASLDLKAVVTHNFDRTRLGEASLGLKAIASRGREFARAGTAPLGLLGVGQRTVGFILSLLEGWFKGGGS